MKEGDAATVLVEPLRVRVVTARDRIARRLEDELGGFERAIDYTRLRTLAGVRRAVDVKDVGFVLTDLTVEDGSGAQLLELLRELGCSSLLLTFDAGRPRPVAALIARQLRDLGDDELTLEQMVDRLLDRQPTSGGAGADQSVETLFDLTTDFLYAFRVSTERELVLEWVTSSFTRATGFRPETLIQRGGLSALVYEEDLPTVRRAIETLLENQPVSFEYRIRTADGETRWLFDNARPEWDDGERRVVQITGAAKDITESRRAAAALAEQQQLYRLLADNIQDLVCLHDEDGTIRYASPSAQSLLGRDPAALVGASPCDLIHPEDRGRVEGELLGPARAGRPSSSLYRIFRADQSVAWFETRLMPLVDDNHDGATRLQSSSRDVTERVAYEEILTHQAYHDPLTDLPNRLNFLRTLREVIPALTGNHDDALAVLFLDLDRFKIVNDTLGHHVGDMLLREVAERLRSCCHDRGLVARLGGDEFVILLEGVERSDEATRLAQRVLETLHEPFHIEGRPLFISGSIGIVLASSGTPSPHALLRDADIAMYRAKRSNAGYALFDASMNASLIEQLEMETSLRQALDRGEFRVHYQPIVRLSDASVVALEALIRWEHPTQGLIGPDRFIPLAEETGLIIPIGDWVLDRACRQLRSWREKLGPARPLSISVNLSARQFSQPRLSERIGDVLRRYAIAPGALIIEITESVVMKDARSTIETLDALKRLGVELAIDDFGTGYSSLSYLQRLPVGHLKIDRAFISEIGENAGDYAIVQAVLALARALDLRVTAEGVESANQLRYLDEMGCHCWQGYHFSRPLPADEIEPLLRSDDLDN